MPPQSNVPPIDFASGCNYLSNFLLTLWKAFYIALNPQGTPQLASGGNTGGADNCL